MPHKFMILQDKFYTESERPSLSKNVATYRKRWQKAKSSSTLIHLAVKYTPREQHEPKQGASSCYTTIDVVN
jgi:hypothetical protein